MPYSIGLQAAANAFLSAAFATQFTLGVVIFLFIVLITSTLQADEADAPPSLPCFSIFAIFPFFRRRYDFLNWGFQATGHSAFQFQLLRLLFQTTLRSLSCSEISDDPDTVGRLRKLYDTLDNGTTPATVLLPWLPTPAMIKKLWATKEIYDIVNKAIQEREKSGISRNDTLQMLLDYGDEKLVVVGFIMGLLIAGARATGTTASWLITFLGCHPEWRKRATSEVESLLANTRTAPSDSLSSRLATLPLDVWESETPVLDAIIKETTRVAQPHTAMRRNLGPPLYIDGKLVPTGAYVIYPFSDVHLDPALYPDPWKFDPGRDNVKNVPFAYVGWGGGKTLCLGTRLAKVELKLITAMFLVGFRHTVVDKHGHKTDPVPNWNDILLCRPPPDQTGYVSYERTNVPL
ncbi:hypothetical protein C0993_011677 [Termitomyces sp. T159_Od127]|nr:hypothetical protein C0993_011677 [Termitomyces sp. T159_Od127]